MCQLKECLKLEKSLLREAPYKFQQKQCFFSQGGVAILRVMQNPISNLILKAFYQGFQMRYHLFLDFPKKVIKTSQNVFLKTRGFYTTCLQEKILTGFNHFPLKIQKRMIPHFKALIKTFQTQEKIRFGITLRMATPP